MGVALLEPDGRGVRLTPQAEVLVRHVERVLVVLDEAEAEVATSLAELTGDVRMAAFQTATTRLVPDAVERLAAAHPGLRVRVAVMEPERSLPALRARDFDIVLTEEYPGQPAPVLPDVHVETLVHDTMRLALPDAGGASPPCATRAWAMEPPDTAARACRRGRPDPHGVGTPRWPRCAPSASRRQRPARLGFPPTRPPSCRRCTRATSCAGVRYSRRNSRRV